MSAPGPSAVHAETPALAARGLSKRFGAQAALDSVDLTIRPGEVHALLGENGSGKSTLIKILAGFYTADAGELERNGVRVPLPLAPGGFRQWGMEFVHQDLGLIPSLSVAENLLIGSLATQGGGWVLSRQELSRRTREILGEYDVQLDPEASIYELTPVERALVAIARALHGIQQTGGSGRAGALLVLDEPSVFLPRRDIERLFAVIRGVAAAGGSVLFVSHDLDEVKELTDRLTVLRDGRVAGVRQTAKVSKDELVELIIGHKPTWSAAGTLRTTAAAPVRLSARGVAGRIVAGVDLAVHEGEILGLTGLVGSGFEELPYLLFGAGHPTAGVIETGGTTIKLDSLSPRRALGMGMALLPGDRRGQGSIGSLSVADNLAMLRLHLFSRLGRLSRRQMTDDARQLMNTFDVRPRDPETAYRNLSGGNQQKALLAKWLATAPRLLLVHEPTQGVDVGAREQIFEVIRDAARSGTAVLCASSDYEQLSLLCDRALVFARGQVTNELVGADLTKERIAEACYRGSTPALIEQEVLL